MSNQTAMAAASAAADDNHSNAAGVDAVVRKAAWRIMPLIMICYLFAFFDRINISFAKFQLQGDLGLSDTAYGLGASLFVVGYVLFEVPSNMFLYKVGARRWIARIMISWGVATAAMVFVTSEWQFYALRFLIGAPVSGQILAHMEGLAGMRGWHWLFLLGGVPCVALGLVVLNQLKDRIEDAHWLTPGEQALLRGSVAQAAPKEGGHSLLGAIRTPGFLTLGLVYFLIQIASYGLNFWAPHLIRSAGTQNPAVIGMLTAVPYVCGAITMLLVGRLSDASGERRKFVAGLLVLAALGFVSAGWFDKNTVLLIVALGVMGAGVVAAIPAFWALPPKLVTGAGAAGGIALINTLGQLGGIVSPVMVGRIKDISGSTTPALYVIAGLSLLCALIVMAGLPQALRNKE